MPSPFPGMDPYIEKPKLWVDFHNRFADVISAFLNQTIRPDYFARLTPYTTYEAVGVTRRKQYAIRPDVGVLQQRHQPPRLGPTRHRSLSPLGSGVLEMSEMLTSERAATETLAVEAVLEQEETVDLLSVEVYERDEEKLVTAIEILSPVNKQPLHEAYIDYRRKRRELLRSDVHLIEIDFLRAGTRPSQPKKVPSAPYYITLSRQEERPNALVWPIQLADRLPTIPVPLLHPDPDVPLPLSEVFASVYERGGYDVQIDYRQPVPTPALKEEEQAWVNRLLSSST